MNRSRWIALVLFIALGFVLAAAAQQKADETAVDPVCGMTVKKASAKAAFDYKGQTYYFCSVGCKDRFAKEPDKYLAKTAPAAQAGKTEEAAACCPKMAGGMGMMMHGGPMMMRHGMRMGMHGHGMGVMGGAGMMPGCPCCGGMANPMMSGEVERKVEKTADGVVVRITSKDPELVKKIQAHFDMMAKMMEKMKAAEAAAAEGCAEGCSEDCPMKKKEVKK